MTGKRIDILTIFPEAFSSYASVSILKRAIEKGEVELLLHDIRQYAEGIRRSVDDVPYGGGAGMVLKPEPIINAIEDIDTVSKKRVNILMTPQGKKLDQKLVRELATYDQLVILCGHYEGVDQRVRDSVIDMEISVGDYVFTGGELPAMVVSDLVIRLVDGVLGNKESHLNDSFENGLLEHPHYTRPATYRGMKVPEVLMSGHHEKIEKWRERTSLEKTRSLRPDLLNEK